MEKMYVAAKMKGSGSDEWGVRGNSSRCRCGGFQYLPFFYQQTMPDTVKVGKCRRKDKEFVLVFENVCGMGFLVERRVGGLGIRLNAFRQRRLWL
jgi:hypothetical protein